MPLLWSKTYDTDGTLIVNAKLVQGESIDSQVTIAVDGVPMNLTGYTLKLQIDLPTPVTYSTATSGIVITDAANGVAQISIADSITETYQEGNWPWEFWIIKDDFAMRYWPGTLTVKKSITAIP